MSSMLWTNCLQKLEQELSDQQLNTWIRPLQVDEKGNRLVLFAPNRFVLDWVQQHFFEQILDTLNTVNHGEEVSLSLEIGSQQSKPVSAPVSQIRTLSKPAISPVIATPEEIPEIENNLNPTFTFDNFVEGKSNQLAKAASQQVAENPGSAYNPLFLYGGVGLGKTHLMHAVGNIMLQHNSNAKVVYLHSEKFVSHMVKSLQHNEIDEFKQHYRNLDALLIDDIQFFCW